MSDVTMVEVLSGFHLNKDSDSVSGFIGEEDIIIQSASFGNQNPITPHSEFTLVGSQNAYVVGINGLMDGHFLCDNVSYNGFFYSDPDLSQYVIDAEKSKGRARDTYMCWAASDANLLYTAGWLTSDTIREDSIFDIYRDSFVCGSTVTGIPENGIDWFLTGRYLLSGNTNYDQLDPETTNGGYFSDSVPNIAKYLSVQDVTSGSFGILVNAIKDLRAGKSVGLGVGQYTINNAYTGHAITLQGYTYENTENVNEIKITGVIVSDSDDDWDYLGNMGSSFAPNTLKVIPIHYIFGYVYLDWNYLNNMYNGYSPARIIHTTTLTPAHFTTMSNGGALISSAATLQDKTIAPLMEMNVSFGGLANRTVLAGGSAHVFGGGKMILDNQAAAAGNVTLGGKLVANNNITCNNLNVVFQLDANTPANSPSPDVDPSLITNLSNMGGISSLGLNIDGLEKYGTYTLASNGSADFLSTKTVTVTNISNNTTSGSLNSQVSTLPFNAGPNRDYTLSYAGGVMTLNISGTNANKTTRCDFHYNGISDVIYISGGTEGQTIKYGLDGTSELQDLGLQSPDLHFVGGYDLNSDHRADVVAHRKIEVNSSKYVEIGYAQSGDQLQWHEISRFDNPDDIDWVVRCGNLTGNAGKNSILWHAPSIGELGYWADAGGFNSWVAIGNVYDSDWEVLGMGDFSNDSVHKDAVLFKYGISTIVEITASGGFRSLGILGDGWEVATIGDFSNDGVDDLILYNAGSGLVGKWADGVSTGWSSLGTVETGVAIKGAGDYNGDGSMDLLARKSDGTMGYYASANVSQFTSFGYAMDSSWTVIA